MLEHAAVLAPARARQPRDRGELRVVVRERRAARPVIRDQQQIGAVSLGGEPAGVLEVVAPVGRAQRLQVDTGIYKSA